MKIIGKTSEGDLIISISQAEWDGLRDGIRPKDDIEILYERWHNTEVWQFLRSQKNLRGKTPLYLLFRQGKLDGTLKELHSILLDEDYHISQVGLSTRKYLLYALLDYMR